MPSRNVTSKVISNRIKSTEQYVCKFFFGLDGTFNSVIELCEGFLCGTKVAFDINQVGFTCSALFFPRPASYNRQFTPNGRIFAQHLTDAEYTERKTIS